jgi:UDP-N-acetylmuramoyl-L-alanyl-D-glutamate--2,6-diaminopimelate ligase
MTALRTPHPLASADAAAAWLAAHVTGRLRTDSRRVGPGDGFIAWPGQASDGRRFVGAALQAGAAAVLVERAGVEAFGLDDGQGRIAMLASLKAATGPIAARYYGRPGERLQVVAVTGTNGKTSTAWWTAQALTRLGRRCGVIGTLGIGEPPPAVAGGEPPPAATGGEPPAALESTGLTTPDPVTLQAALRDMADRGCAACAIEASSIGIAEHRLDATPIAVAQFTNFTRDHLDFHGDMAHYWACKRALFDWPGLRAAVVNVDDARGAELAAALRARAGRSGVTAVDLWTTAVHDDAARLQACALHYRDGGLAFDLVEGDHRMPVRSRLIGDYNAANLLAVLGALRALGVPLDEAASVVPALTPVPGRMQRVASAAKGQPAVVVDYAHTPDALEHVLQALRPLATARAGRLWCVFGCGGNRDTAKRPLMGAIAHRLADHVVLTSDNPRHEAPAQILAMILAGTAGAAEVDVIENRRTAISDAIARADARDVLLIAGKGHEDYQEAAGRRLPFSDVAVAGDALRQRGT